MSESLGDATSFNLAPATTDLAEQIAVEGDIVRYIDGVGTYYEGTPIHEILSSLASLVEPVDRTTGDFNPNAPAARAFFRGGLLGLRAVEISYGTDMILALDGQTVNLQVSAQGNDTHDPQHALHLLARSLQAMGDEGLRLVEDMHEQLDEWDVQVAEDVTVAPYFKRGFGFAVDVAKRYQDMQNLDAFKGLMEALGVSEGEFEPTLKEFDLSTD